MYICIYCGDYCGYNLMICDNCENKEEIKNDKKLGYDNGFKHGFGIAKKKVLNSKKLELFPNITHRPSSTPTNVNDIFFYSLMYREGYIDAYNEVKRLNSLKNVLLTELIDNHDFKESMTIILDHINIYKYDHFEPRVCNIIKKFIFPIEYS